MEWRALGQNILLGDHNIDHWDRERERESIKPFHVALYISNLEKYIIMYNREGVNLGKQSGLIIDYTIFSYVKVGTT